MQTRKKINKNVSRRTAIKSDINTDVKFDIKTDFLLKEYEEMFEEKRHHDSRFQALVSFYFWILTATVSVISIINALKDNETLSIHQLQLTEILMSFIICIIGVMVLLSLYFDRVNYIKTCKQINAIRAFCLDNEIPSFKNKNRMYVNDAYPKFYRKKSTAFLFFYFFSTCNGVFFSFFVIKLLSFLSIISFSLPLFIILAIILFVIQTMIIRVSTKKRDKDQKRSSNK